MNRRVLRFSAIIGAAAVSTLAIAPVFAAAPVSQATAQSIDLSIGGTHAVTQLTTATNDGTQGTNGHVVEDNTLPSLVGIIPNNNALSAAVAVQSAGANDDGTSYACAGVAGTGSAGAVNVGHSSCNIDGKPLTLGLANLNLNLSQLLGGQGAITTAIDGALGAILHPAGSALDDALNQITSALATTPLGAIKLSGGLSAVEASCTANPTAAHGDSKIADTSGGGSIPITLTIPTGTGNATQDLVLANVNVDVAPKPGGTDVLVNLDVVTQALINAINTELTTALAGQLAPLAVALGPVVQGLLQNQLITPLVTALTPALQALSDNVLKLVVNDVTPGDAGRSVEVTTLKVQVLGALAQATGSALIDGIIGHVTCGPNRAVVENPPTPTPTEQPPGTPTVVDSGLNGASHTTRDVLMATTVLMLLAGSAGLIGYRRMLTK